MRFRFRNLREVDIHLRSLTDSINKLSNNQEKLAKSQEVFKDEVRKELREHYKKNLEAANSKLNKILIGIALTAVSTVSTLIIRGFFG